MNTDQIAFLIALHGALFGCLLLLDVAFPARSHKKGGRR